ncbi:SDR family NAD(P)-dependent oxidoreductase [Neobacillus sp. NPDC058068]|uniref:SDR family NAD(P)-dependent oxidoreductase n=1 Tax=Neobacillus sp. NPDC058068 TaxID=3346325 RepID=UPI0036DA2C77
MNCSTKNGNRDDNCPCSASIRIYLILNKTEHFKGKLAGIASGFDDFETLDIEAWQHIFDVNVFGTVRVTKAVIPFMKKAGFGRIINISSESGLQTEPMKKLLNNF